MTASQQASKQVFKNLDATDAPRGEAELIAIADELDQLRDVADELDNHAVASSTRRYYTADWEQFERWCARLQRPPLPADPENIRLYITDLALQLNADGSPRYKVSSIRRHVSSIARMHYEAGHGRGLGNNARIAQTIGSLSRLRQEAATPKRPLLRDDIINLGQAIDHSTWPAGVAAARDWLTILLGFATALRRSEVAALRYGDVTCHPTDGLLVRVTKSKTDQEGHGALVAVPYGQYPATCAPCAWARWIKLVLAGDRPARMRAVRDTDPIDNWSHICRTADADAGIDPAAPLLRTITKAGTISASAPSGAALNEALTRRLEAAGYDSAHYGFHSLRAGFVTQARRNGADTRSIRRQTRHGSDAMVDRYDRDYNPLNDNAVTKLGL